MIKTILGLGAGLLGSMYNADKTKELNQQNAKLNQHYWDIQNQKLYEQSEQSADKAMQRSIDMYNLLQSPSSMVKQLKDAGLNPALMYSGSGMGGHVQSGPQAQAQAGQGAPTMGLQNFVNLDPLTIAQIQNINADTTKKKEETKLTKSQTETQNVIKKVTELEADLKKQDRDMNEQTWALRYNQIMYDSQLTLQQAIAEQWANKITEETFTEQVEIIGQNLLNLKATHELLKSQKNLTDEQINEVLQKINLMSAQIWELSTRAELNEEELTKLVNDREWNYISKEDAKFLVSQSVDVLKSLLDIIPIGKAKQLIKTIITKKEGNTTTTTVISN